MNRLLGWICLALFLASIPFANWWLTEHGLWRFPFLGLIPSAVWVVGIAFVVRDIAQLMLGKAWAVAAIAAGIVLSWWVADQHIALASACAFAISETTDAAIFTPLANKNKTHLFLIGISISGYAASFLDSAVFIRLAFHHWSGWWQFSIAKILFVMAATPVAWGVRHAVLARDAHAVVALAD